MPVISRILLHEKYVQLQTPFKTATTTLSQKHVLFVELVSDAGTTVTAECVAGDWPGYSDETVETAKACIETQLIPCVLDRPFDHPSEVDDWLKDVAPEQPMARAVIEMGAWSLAAEESRTPLDEYLKGTHRMIPVGKTLGIQASLDDLVRAAREASQEGYQRLKLKVTPETVLVTLEVLHKKVKSLIPLVLDGNGSFSASDLALFKEVDRYRPMMWEQPLPKDAWKDSAELQRHIYTPICLDESIQSLLDVEKMVKMKAGKIVCIKPGCVGGFTESLAIENYCRQYHIPTWVGGMLETSVGKAYLSAFATRPGITLPSDLMSSFVEE